MRNWPNGVSANTISNLEAGRGHLPRQTTLDLQEQAELRAAFREAGNAGRAPRQPTALRSPATPSLLPAGSLTFLVCRPVPSVTFQPEQVRATRDILNLAMLLQQGSAACCNDRFRC